MKVYFSHFIITVLLVSTQQVTAAESTKQTKYFQKVVKTAKVKTR